MNVISFGDIFFKSNFKRSGSQCMIKHMTGDQGDERWLALTLSNEGGKRSSTTLHNAF